jgi:hypothetical protein
MRTGSMRMTRGRCRSRREATAVACELLKLFLEQRHNPVGELFARWPPYSGAPQQCIAGEGLHEDHSVQNRNDLLTFLERRRRCVTRLRALHPGPVQPFGQRLQHSGTRRRPSRQDERRAVPRRSKRSDNSLAAAARSNDDVSLFSIAAVSSAANLRPANRNNASSNFLRFPK